jgi:hypothetical protein
MMGRLDRDHGQFLYCFNLEEVVPEDHLVRAIAAVLDLIQFPRRPPHSILHPLESAALSRRTPEADMARLPLFRVPGNLPHL